MPSLPYHPPDFVPAGRFTQERLDAMDIDPDHFLTPTELKLAITMISQQIEAVGWGEMEKGVLKEEFFDPVLIPTIEHVPWVLRNIPIPPGCFDDVVAIVKDKIASGTYERSNSSYRSRWFCVVKKDGKSLRIVHDLQQLNQNTIRDAAVPPNVDILSEMFGGRACITVLDLLVAFDQRKLNPVSRDLTTFSTPLGTFRLTSLPMGYTNSFQVMHNDITFVLQDEIPHVTYPYSDDVAIKGPATRYELPDGGYETIPQNPNIRRFVWEHLNDVNRILQRVKVVGGRFSGKKMTLCQPQGVVVGFKCTYDGRIPEDSKVQKIRDWPSCETVSDVRGFLGTCGVLRIFIKDFAKIARPLVELTRKETAFHWDHEEQQAMDILKNAVITSPALRAIDYKSSRPVIFAVDSSIIGVGFVLLQVGDDKRRYPNRFGSINWNERESRYSQPKLELYGLFRALRAMRIFIIGVKNLIVEVDAKYIKGMINNPDLQPNATINRWIAGILLFTFELVHVPGVHHAGADGLSRRRPSPEDEEEEDDFEEWIDDAYSLMLASTADDVATPVPVIPRSDRAVTRDARIGTVQRFLTNPSRPDGLSDTEFKAFIKYALEFFVRGETLWRKAKNGKHKVVVPEDRRFALIKAAHDELGHKGVFSVRMRLLDRFWWPMLDADVKWYVRTCHECQIRQMRQIHIPPTVATPAPLFRKAYIDTMLMPKSEGHRYLVQARCSLTSYPEFRALKAENARTISRFIYEDILCRWGALEEIVTDNGPAFVAAAKYLVDRYHIHHIRISPYNSQANGPVERRHLDVREALMKTVEGDESKWFSALPSVFWAERITTQRGTGFSPYYMAHGVEPLLPFDISEATYLLPPQDAPMSTSDLLATRGRALRKRPEDLELIHERVLKSRYLSIKHFEEKFKETIRDFNFAPGSLVLVQNSRIHSELNRKTKPRYLGPMVVVRRTTGGSYILSELNGALSRSRYSASRVVPYHPRSVEGIPVTSQIDLADLDLASATMDDTNLHERSDDSDNEDD